MAQEKNPQTNEDEKSVELTEEEKKKKAHDEFVQSQIRYREAVRHARQFGYY